MSELPAQPEAKKPPKDSCEPKMPDPVLYVYLTTVAEKQRRAEKQLELYAMEP